MRKHLIHHFFLLALALGLFNLSNHNFNFPNHIIWPTVIILISHYLIDTLKYHEKIRFGKGHAFLLDQLLHFTVISLVFLFFFSNDATLSIKHGLQLIGIIDAAEKQSIRITDLLLILLIIGILVTEFSSHLIRHYLKEPELKIKSDNSTDNGKSELDPNESTTLEYIEISRGKFIGCLERLLVILLMIFGVYEGIGLIVAAKTFARFKQLDNREWAEYFLSGTLLSMILGILFGAIVSRLVHLKIVI